MTKPPRIVFLSADHSPIPIRNRQALKAFLEKIFRRNKKKLISLNYVFCRDSFLLEINREFLGHDDYTDIISFNLNPNPKLINGEIYISVDRAKENAKNIGTSRNSEFHRLIFHGALHLCGYKDKTIRDQAQMREMEDRLMMDYLGFT